MLVNFATSTYRLGDAEGDTVSGFENFRGTDNADSFTGDSSDNVIYGSPSRDTIDGGDGTDTLTYASFDTGVLVNVTTDDVRQRVSNVEIIIGSNYDDTINGDSVDNTIRGGNGLDTLRGNAGDDKLYGGNHNDHLDGGAGADTIDGGDGGDTVHYASSPSGVTVNLTTNVNTGGHAQGDKLYSIQHIEGSAHADTLTGDEHDNYFWGGAGADAFDGKGGTDWVYYATGDDGLTLDMATPANSTGHAKGDTFTSIERGLRDGT